MNEKVAQTEAQNRQVTPTCSVTLRSVQGVLNEAKARIKSMTKDLDEMKEGYKTVKDELEKLSVSFVSVASG